MRWQGRRQSENVEDRRGMTPRMRGGVGIGCGGLILVVLFALITGADPASLLQLLGGIQANTSGPATAPTGDVGPPSDDLGRFAATVLADTEDTWNGVFRELGRQYEEPVLVLFDDAVASACGFNSAAVGPFYCPLDRRVYIDLGFFDQLERRFGAPGDFAQAYVLAHEVGHHVQNLLGISDQVRQMQMRSGQARANERSVRLELQADCLAGVWARQANDQRGLLEPGDLEEGLRAAAAIGDDTIQRRAQGYTVPETWTHGSAEQRVTWLRRGMEAGSVSACETFQ